MAQGETEDAFRRFVADFAAVVPDLTGISGGPAPSSDEPRGLQRVYYDLGDRSLLRHGITVAGPEEGRAGSWCLAFPAEFGRLDLHTGPVEAGRVPPELLDRVRVHVRDRDLAPLLRVSIRRQVTTYDGPDGSPALSITEDELVAEGGAVRTKEWILEVPGHDGRVNAVESLLLDSGAERGNAAAFIRDAVGIPEFRPGPGPAKEKGTVGAILATAFRAVAAELMAWDPRVRVDEEGAVHQLRVRSRTLRSMLRTYGKLLAKETARDLERRLQHLGHTLSAARDAEVMRGRIHMSAQEQPAGTVPGHVVRRLHKKSEAEYRQAYEALLEELNSPGYFQLLALLEEFSARPPLRGRAAEKHDARKLLRSAAKRQLRQVLELIAAADKEQDPPAQLSLLHDVRKRSKRLRYAIRSVSTTTGFDFGKKLDAVMAFSEDIQDALGAHRDSVLFQQYLVRTAREAHRSGANTFAYGILYQAEVPLQEAADAAYREAAGRLQ